MAILTIRRVRAIVIAATAVAALTLAPGLLSGTARADQALPICGSLFGAGFSASHNPALTGQSINFDGSCSKVPCPAFGGFANCPPDSWTWDFGDGTGASGPTATHTYSSAGTYTVTLSVADHYGDSGGVSHQVTVLSVP
jgi:hypothetical protein